MKKIDPVLIYEKFKSRFENEPVMIQSPARVNLIGEHTDYNNGYVLPASIDKKIIMAIAPNCLKKIRMFAMDMDQSEYEIDISGNYQKSGRGWPDYILGVVDQLSKNNHQISGFDCLFAGDIPIGAGLSSSAAIEGGILTGLEKVFNLKLTPMQKVLIGQQAENQLVGVNCGIMDQFTNIHGQAGSVIRLDCKTLEYTYFPFNTDDISILLCDTKVRRELAYSEYNVRREQCEEGVKSLSQFDPKITSLRDVKSEMLENKKTHLSDVVYKRCRYVLDENSRVLEACECLTNEDLESFGEIMYKSHKGLRDLYEVSCIELDTLVELTRDIPGIFGARMMGGGFGGCTVNLVSENQINEVTEEIKKQYKMKVNTPLEFYIARFSDGVGVLNQTVVENGR